MDVNYTERIGIYYPNKGDSVANMDGCPLFWRNESNKVTIDPAVLNVHFFHGMGAVAYSAGMVYFSCTSYLDYNHNETNGMQLPSTFSLL